MTLILKRVLSALRGRSRCAHGESGAVSGFAVDLSGTRGFLVADAAGRPLGRVECAMYGSRPDRPDALSVRSGRLLGKRRRLVPAELIQAVDAVAGVIGLRVSGEQILTFL